MVQATVFSGLCAKAATKKSHKKIAKRSQETSGNIQFDDAVWPALCEEKNFWRALVFSNFDRPPRVTRGHDAAS
jgi:hypothetical protein